MASQASEPRDLLERWKADHPELVGNGGRSAPAAPARPRLVPPAPPPPRVTQESPQAMIDRWRAEHPELSTTRPQPRVDPAPARRDRDGDANVIDIANTPLTVLAAFIIGCLIGGIAMTIITGIAFWGFSGA